MKKPLVFSLLFLVLPYIPASDIFFPVGFVAAERTEAHTLIAQCRSPGKVTNYHKIQTRTEQLNMFEKCNNKNMSESDDKCLKYSDKKKQHRSNGSAYKFVEQYISFT